MRLLNHCKICGSPTLQVFAHTATCRNCGVLLCYPYPEFRETRFESGEVTAVEEAGMRQAALDWHIESGDRNHHNFTNMALFTLDDTDRRADGLDVLDFGGGGGQFAAILKSLFPKANAFIVDMQNALLLDVYRPIQTQIRFENFADDTTKFDVIFMNDVYEHLSDPVRVLGMLREKLKPGGRIFIDTPCQFWLYPLTRLLSKTLHTKLLKGTVDHDHQQIWSTRAFEISVDKARLRIKKFSRLSEYTMGAAFYLNNMGVRNPIVRIAGCAFFELAPYIARNKICAVLDAAEP